MQRRSPCRRCANAATTSSNWPTGCCSASATSCRSPSCRCPIPRCSAIRRIRLARQRPRTRKCTRTRRHSVRRRRHRSGAARDRLDESRHADAPQSPPDDAETQTSLEGYFVKFVLEHQDALTETELANKLGISRKSLWERRQRLNIPRKRTGTRAPRRDSDTDASRGRFPFLIQRSDTISTSAHVNPKQL